MFKIISSFCVLGLIFYGLTDYCLPQPVANETNQMFLGKFSYATNWVSCFSAITLIFFLLYLALPRVARHPLKLALSISLPLQLFVCAFYWGLYFKNPLAFQKQKFIDQGIVTSMFTSLVQHAFPLFGLIVTWWYHPIYISRKVYFALMALVTAYFVFACLFYIKEREWPYPFLNQMKVPYIAALFVAVSLSILIIYEVLRYVEKIRRLRRIKKNLRTAEKKGK